MCLLDAGFSTIESASEPSQFIHIFSDLSIISFGSAFICLLVIISRFAFSCPAPFAQLLSPCHAIFDLFLFLLPIQCLMTFKRAQSRDDASLQLHNGEIGETQSREKEKATTEEF